jgi:hypothetical protein
MSEAKCSSMRKSWRYGLQDSAEKRTFLVKEQRVAAEQSYAANGSVVATCSETRGIWLWLVALV